ncbi:unnamed protein product [Ascophyllum nodosum]
MLYSKGLGIMPEDATLHGNLAAVRLGLNKPQAALENSEEAVRLDPGYAKGYYRKGQALMALSRPVEAAETFRLGAKLEPESKLWAPLVGKAVKAAEAGPPAAAAAAATSRTSAPSNGSKVTASSVSSRTATGGTTSSSSSRPAKKNGAETSTESNMKGYKKTADGRLTTYFNNELSEEAKALIGDIAPKKLQGAEAAGDTTGSSGVTSNVASAWNKAGTWESRDMTSWAKERLSGLLKDVEFDAPESIVTVVKIENLEGDAEVSYSRGKKRYMFDFRFDLKWEAPDLDEGPAKGVLAYPDVGQDCGGIYEAECRVDNSTPKAARGFVDRHVRAEQSGLRQAVLARLVTFAEEFHSK